MNPVDSTQTKKKILLAANNVVLRDGSNALTLDAVCKEAGISKGGLLYHYNTKEALIAAMIEALISGADESMQARQAEDPNPKGSWARAYINTCRQSDEADQISAAMIPAAASDPALLEPLRQYYEDWQRKLDADLGDTSRSTLIRLALDGLWLADLLCLAAPQGERREEFFATLNSLTEQK
jgi:AcrR family transcriptional regulator